MDMMFIDYLARFGHMLFGVTWIGLLYYFNFVQTEYFKEAEPAARVDAFSKLAPRALWWFRWGAMGTFLTGVILLGYRHTGLTADITVGALMGTLMFLNVWLIIWPNQKIVIGLDPGDKAVAGPKAALASRTNTLFSLPMLYFMVASAHAAPMANGGLLGGVGEIAMSSLALVIGLVIIALIEINAIWGKMNGAIASVKAVITSSVVLTAVMTGIVYYV